MTRAAHSEEYTRECGQVLYVAFELGAKEWKLGFTTDLAATVRVRVMPAREVGRVRRELTEAKEWYGLVGTAAVRSCYEAGRDGFWLHRWLTREGIDNRVVDSSSIEVNRRQRRAKSDGLDARKLVGMLVRYHTGEPRVWSVLRVPTVAAEDGRQLHRALRTLKQDLARVTNRIKGLLATQGIGGGPRGALGGDLEEGRGWEMAKRCRPGCGRGCSGSGRTPSPCRGRSGRWRGSGGRPWLTRRGRRWSRWSACCACGRSG